MLRTLPILFVSEKRNADAETIKKGTDSLALMERAATHVAHYVLKEYHHRIRRVVTVCGTGNNGGDGFAAARILSPFYETICFLAGNQENLTPDSRINLNFYIKSGGKVLPFSEKDFLNCCTPDSIILDAIFGSGLNKPISDSFASIIHCLNSTGNPIISIDIPSGMRGDDLEHLAWQEAIVKSTHTITFQTPYLSFLFQENECFVSNFSIGDIGLDSEYINEIGSKIFLSDKAFISSLIKKRPSFGHKGTFGRVIVLGGTKNMCGAGMIAAQAAKSTGAGLVYLTSSECCRTPAQTFIPEIIFLESDIVKTGINFPDADVLAIGPGLGLKSKNLIVDLLQKFPQCPVVLDADGLNILCQNDELWSMLENRTILTPHSGEFDRLSKRKFANSLDRLEEAKRLANQKKCVILLKGRYSAVCSTKGEVFFNSTGNHWLATGGSGDMLTGIIAGLLSQGYDLLEGSLIACWLHGKAADLAVYNNFKPLSLSDLLYHLPRAMKEINFGKTKI